ncbi:hypothetical protein Hsar01_00228 [Haloferula sargassicola]|uniref:Uncharacterized protein n=2 Tax=Haloferula sargassicola TaxID=490096 RepID=A0ABP9UMM8_9BACT
MSVAYSEISKEKHQEIMEAFRYWKQVAEDAVSDPSTENMEKLSRGIEKMRRPVIFPTEERFVVRDELVQAMLSIPGSVGFFEKKYYQAKKEWKAGSLRQQEYIDVIGETIGTIRYLPSPESVRVLGNLIDDQERLTADEVERMPVAFWALRGLMNLIEDGPVYSDDYVEQIIDRKMWVLWFEQVKAGTRTFRFKGDPQPYTLAGPAEKELRPLRDGDEGVEARRQKTTERGNPEISTGTGEEDGRKIPWLPLGLATLLAGGGGVYWWRQSRKAAP